MESYILDWLSLIFRWLHLITGIAWIGASFYFIWLDNSLETPPRWKQDKGCQTDGDKSTYLAPEVEPVARA